MTTTQATTPTITNAGTKPAVRHKLFVNIPVSDLQRSIRFFEALGFRFNRQFTDATAACMLVGDDAYFMLLVRDRFKEFSKRAVGDPRTETNALFAISVGSKTDVDTVVRKAVAAGGSHAADPQDHGFMYQWSFYDLDGHHWEVFWMDGLSWQVVPPMDEFFKRDERSAGAERAMNAMLQMKKIDLAALKRAGPTPWISASLNCRMNSSSRPASTTCTPLPPLPGMGLATPAASLATTRDVPPPTDTVRPVARSIAWRRRRAVSASGSSWYSRSVPLMSR